MPALTFLVVDDNELQRRIVDACLEEAGHQVMFAASAEEVDDVLAAVQAQVVVVSAALPVEEARAAVAAAMRPRTSPDTGAALPPPAVVVGAGPADQPVAEQLIARGAAGRIARPYPAERLAPQLELFAVGSAPATILVIDDSVTTRKTSCSILRTAGHEVLEAPDGAAGIAMLAEHPEVDLVLSDLVMPKMDGYGVTQAIRARESTRNLPVLLLTGMDDIASQSRAIEVGCDDVLSKPITATELQMRVRSMLRLKNLQRTLAARNTDLEQALQLREHLTHLLVHDFKNPLTRVLVSAEMIAEQCEEAQLADAHELAEDVMAGALRLRGLTEDLLQVARIEDGVAEPKRSVFSLSELLGAIAGDVQRVAQVQGVALQVDGAADLRVDADREWVYRVLQNLVDNAIKFTPSGSQVLLTATRADSGGSRARVCVIDGGPGIPEEYRERIFEKFAQVPRTERRGSGLGLAFCRLAVEAHGGTITAAPRDDGQPGSVFAFTLPLA